MITQADLLAIAPVVVLAAGITLVMLQIALRRGVSLTRYTSLLVLAVALAACLGVDSGSSHQVTPLLMADSLAALLAAAFCMA
ncbi:MAG: NADH-quinone oxidoreductase subunit N, partial [Congregibacter sp.]|nr:NADH-quinone oxidoreductase subunit N [Congregibacter sp.]